MSERVARKTEKQTQRYSHPSQLRYKEQGMQASLYLPDCRENPRESQCSIIPALHEVLGT